MLLAALFWFIHFREPSETETGLSKQSQIVHDLSINRDHIKYKVFHSHHHSLAISLRLLSLKTEFYPAWRYLPLGERRRTLRQLAEAKKASKFFMFLYGVSTETQKREVITQLTDQIFKLEKYRSKLRLIAQQAAAANP